MTIVIIVFEWRQQARHGNEIAELPLWKRLLWSGEMGLEAALTYSTSDLLRAGHAKHRGSRRRHAALHFRSDDLPRPASNGAHIGAEEGDDYMFASVIFGSPTRSRVSCDTLAANAVHRNVFACRQTRRCGVEYCVCANVRHSDVREEQRA